MSIATVSTARTFAALSARGAFAVLTFGACAQRTVPAAPAPEVVVSAPERRMTPAMPMVDMSAPPVLAPVSPLTLPAVVTRTLPNGLRLLIVEHHELPIADFSLIIGTGGEADPARHSGLAGVTANMLEEGTRTRSALELADQTGFLGVSLSAGSSWDQSAISMHTPTVQLDSALAIMADVALNPAFPRAELERMRTRRLTSLLQLKDRAPDIANRAFASLVYGPAHPYGRPLAGTEASMKAITRSDLERFYATYYRPNNATMIVVGDVSADDIERRVTALFGGWKRAKVPVAKYGALPSRSGTTVYLIDKPGAPQSSFRIGLVGAPRSTDDYFALEVMNTILGGSFTSRLNNNLRETRGFTYGAGSRFALRREAGPFTASAEITGTKTDSALAEFMREFTSILDTVPESELTKAKRYIQLQLPGEFETTQDIAGKLLPVAVYGLPLDYYNSYAQRVSEVTQSDVQRVARRYVRSGELVVVIVGDRKLVEPGLRASKVGALELRDIEARPIPR